MLISKVGTRDIRVPVRSAKKERVRISFIPPVLLCCDRGVP